MQIFTCLRCRHEWPSKKEKPVTCAKCRSPYWNVAKGVLTKKNIEGLYESIINGPEPTHVPKNISVPAEQTPPPLEPQKEEIKSLQSLIDSIHAKKEPQAPWVAPKVEQYDLSEPTVNYD